LRSIIALILLPQCFVPTFVVDISPPDGIRHGLNLAINDGFHLRPEAVSTAPLFLCVELQ